MPAQLSTAEVAARLGVKPETIYAYVSRGLLRSHRNADGRGSRFDQADVDALARQRGVPARGPIVSKSAITEIADGRLAYRGHDVAELARTRSYEEVVGLLWTGEPRPVELTPSPELVALARAVTAVLPRPRLYDRLPVIVAAVAAADPLRFDVSPAAVIDTGRVLLPTMIEALPVRGRTGSKARSQAARLWRRLTSQPPTEAGLAVLNSALCLMADHDLAASTVAARVAASTHAHPYAVISTGLGAMDGPLHGGMSGMAYQLLTDAVTDDPVRALGDRLRAGGPVPGFGHQLYPSGDPRAAFLLAALDELPADERLRKRVRAVHTTMTARSGVQPNTDFALAALALLTGMDADAGEIIFATARSAGWLAHALEEYANRPNPF